MLKLELHRLTPLRDDPGNILETRETQENDLNQYFMKEFGRDNNGGINTALSYVEQKYGGGKYQLRIYQNNKYVGSQTFEISGPRRSKK